MLLGSRCEPDDVREESISYGVNTPYDNSGTLWFNLGNKPNKRVVKKQPSINSINYNQITRAAPRPSGRAKKQILIKIYTALSRQNQTQQELFICQIQTTR
jgi:hypothetical protein